MSAVGKLSVAQLREHVAALARSGKKLDDPNFGDFPIHELESNAHSRCGIASEAVEDHLRAHGVAHRNLDLSTGIPWNSVHYATEVPTTEGPHVVDLTYNQFKHELGPAPQWPLVEHRSAYMRRGFMEGHDR